LPVGVAALAAGAAVAQASGGGAATTRAPRAAPAPPAVALAPARPAPLPYCRPARRDRRAPRTPPSEALKSAFGILRRERRDEDALPARALKALEAQGLAPVDPESARLLRADGAARAWVVPVPDVGAATPFACVRGAAAAKPREGLAVVSVGAAPAGGGGALRDLQRGLAPAALDPCAGTAGRMLGVSGIVPDGVEAVFVTAADGTSTRADVRDNAYAFVLPRPRRPEQRYLVWTGSDGGPHVQPLPPIVIGGRMACERPAAVVRVTPDPWGPGCGPFGGPPVMLAPRPVAPRRKRASRVPPGLQFAMPGPCIVVPPPMARMPAPPATVPVLPRDVVPPLPAPARPAAPGAPRATVPVPARPPVPAPARPAPARPAPAPAPAPPPRGP